jgi:DNA-binding transcriptional ArsR family regulator
VCPDCHAKGQLSALAAPGALACLYHLRHPAPKRRQAAPARPSGRKKAGPQGWQRRFLRGPAVKKAPKTWRDGSRRRLSPERLEDHAALLVVQAVAARRADRPTAWLALVMFYLDLHRPAGASRSDARDNAVQLAAVLAVSADWRSGRRSRPGRQVAAGLLGLAERTITRHLALLEHHGLVERQGEGELLNAERRAEAAAEEDASPDQQQRWTNRAEWILRIPAWVREITDEQLWPYVERAAAMLDELAGPARGRRAVDNPAGPAVDNSAGQAGNIGSVTPSISFQLLGSLPLRRGSFSLALAVDKPAAAPTGAEREKGHKGGASRHSPTRAAGKTRKGGMTPWAVRLARQIVQDGRLPVGGYRHMPALISVLRKLLGPSWQLDDVLAEVRLRLRETGKPMLTRPDRPMKYLKWLLASAVASEPPAQITAAAVAAVKDRAAGRAEQWRVQEAAAVAARATGSGIQEARQVARSIAERRRREASGC